MKKIGFKNRLCQSLESNQYSLQITSKTMGSQFNFIQTGTHSLSFHPRPQHNQEPCLIRSDSMPILPILYTKVLAIAVKFSDLINILFSNILNCVCCCCSSQPVCLTVKQHREGKVIEMFDSSQTKPEK